MSYEGRRIWYRKSEDGEITYLVARGDGTDEIFLDWKDAILWIAQKGWRDRKRR